MNILHMVIKVEVAMVVGMDRSEMGANVVEELSAVIMVVSV